MGVARAGNLETVGLSNAQVIDGGLRFDSGKSQYLSRTPGSAGNRQTWTWSGWVKRNSFGVNNNIFSGVQDGNNGTVFYFDSNNCLAFFNYVSGSYAGRRVTTNVYRDSSSWYHILLVWDSTNATVSNRIRIYVNGTEVTTFSTNTDPSSANSIINSTNSNQIGADVGFNNGYSSLQISNAYFIDGQALTPSSFGYTDPLTNTWRPKKYTGTFTGTNTFYLPLDGNTPIGQDRSGNNNNWTPVNFGGSNTLEKATGALPILNTDGGGKVARVGVRTDSNASSLVLALPLVGIKSDFSNAINSGTSNKAVTANSATASSSYSNFYGGSFYFNGSSNLAIPQSTSFDFGSGDCTVECWLYISSHDQDKTIAGRWEVSDQAWQLSYGVGSGNTKFGFSQNIGGTQTAESSVVSSGYAGQWVHLAGQRTGNTLQIYVNGVLEGTKSVSGAHSALSGDIRIGGRTSGNYITGYIQDLRIYKGLAKYTQNFIPASTDPDILPDTPSGVAYSSNVALVPSTDGAVAFDGSSGYLSFASNTDFDFGTGNFTIEGFIYPNTTGDQRILGGVSPTYEFAANQSNGLIFGLSGTFSTNLGGNYSINKWNHFALVRNGSTVTGYIDGIQCPTTHNIASNSVSFDSSGTIIGRNHLSAGTAVFTNGTISNLHVVKGTALYTSNFTPPTGPISSVANTKLLCCKSNSNPKLADSAPNIGITTNTQFNTNFETIPTTVNGISITNNGSVSTTSAGTNSFGFTNGANFTGSNSLTANIGTVPALSTIDLVFKVNGTTNNKYLFGMSANGLVRRSSSNLAWYNGSTDQTVYTSPDDGAWHHLRVTPTDLYFDGTRIQNTGSLANINNEGVAGNNGGLMAIGAYRDASQTTYNGAVIFGLVRIMPGVDLGAPTVPITTNGTLSGSATIPNDGVIIRNGNTAASNFNPFTVNINTQRGQESGYPTLNPLDKPSSASVTISNGNLRATDGNSGLYSLVVSNAGLSTSITDTGYYLEVTNLKTTSGNSAATGFSFWRVGGGTYNNYYPPGNATYNPNNGYAYMQGGSVTPWGGSSVSSQPTWQTAGDVFSVAVKGSNVWFAKNGVWISGNPATGTSPYTTIPSGYGQVFPAALALETGDQEFNFGQKPFKFPPPAGFQPLALANTPRPTIVRPDRYVGISTWTGDDVNNRKITTNFKPDLFWAKSRSSTPYHTVNDSVRGVNAILQTNTTSPEQVNSNGYVTAFLSDGVTVTNGSDINSSSYGNYVGWAWKAGGSGGGLSFWKDDAGYSTASAAGLTAGTITPTGASVGTKNGFSIIRYTGTGANATVSHGLGNAPAFMMFKQRTATGGTSGVTNWRYYHTSLGNTKAFYVPANTISTSSSHWNNTSPTSTVFTIGTDDGVNDPGSGFICYAWAEIPGFSKFSSYTGNGSSDGPMIVTGFRPRWIMLTETTNAGYWFIFDTERSKTNPTAHTLWADQAQVENWTSINPDTTYNNMDILSNGFKLRSSYSATNRSSGNYIYAAFAETPSFNLYGGQSNAR